MEERPLSRFDDPEGFVATLLRNGSELEAHRAAARALRLASSARRCGEKDDLCALGALQALISALKVRHADVQFCCDALAAIGNLALAADDELIVSSQIVPSLVTVLSYGLSAQVDSLACRALAIVSDRPKLAPTIVRCHGDVAVLAALVRWPRVAFVLTTACSFFESVVSHLPARELAIAAELRAHLLSAIPGFARDECAVAAATTVLVRLDWTDEDMMLLFDPKSRGWPHIINAAREHYEDEKVASAASALIRRAAEVALPLPLKQNWTVHFHAASLQLVKILFRHEGDASVCREVALAIHKMAADEFLREQMLRASVATGVVCALKGLVKSEATTRALLRAAQTLCGSKNRYEVAVFAEDGAEPVAAALEAHRDSHDAVVDCLELMLRLLEFDRALSLLPAARWLLAVSNTALRHITSPQATFYACCAVHSLLPGMKAWPSPGDAALVSAVLVSALRNHRHPKIMDAACACICRMARDPSVWDPSLRKDFGDALTDCAAEAEASLEASSDPDPVDPGTVTIAKTALASALTAVATA